MKKKFNHLMGTIFGYQFTKSSGLSTDPIIDTDEYFQKLYIEIKPYTMTSMLKCYALYKAVKYIVKAEIPGDFVECGVWKGGSAILIARVLRDLGVTDRKIYMYDTYSGMVKPSLHDKTVESSRKNPVKIWQSAQKKAHNEWCLASFEEVQENIRVAGYDVDNFILIKGTVEETIPQNIPQKIALLRLDTDWYESTRHELSHLYPLLEKAGILIIDDYGYWAGQRKAVDEYFNKIPFLLHRIDKGGRIGVKI